jgi:hypothetical protein
VSSERARVSGDHASTINLPLLLLLLLPPPPSPLLLLLLLPPPPSPPPPPPPLLLLLILLLLLCIYYKPSPNYHTIYLTQLPHPSEKRHEGIPSARFILLNKHGVGHVAVVPICVAEML